MVNWVRTWVRLGEYTAVFKMAKVVGIASGKEPKTLLKIAKKLFFRFHALMPEEAYENDEDYKNVVKEWASYT